MLLVGVIAVLTFLALLGGALPVGAGPRADRRRRAVTTVAPTDTTRYRRNSRPGGIEAARWREPGRAPTAVPAAAADARAYADTQPESLNPVSPPTARRRPHRRRHRTPSARPCPGNPGDLLASLFNPIFQTLFLGLAAGYQLFGDIGIAIIVLTLASRPT